MIVFLSKWMTDYYHTDTSGGAKSWYAQEADVPEAVLEEYKRVTARFFELNKVLNECFVEAGGTDAQH